MSKLGSKDSKVQEGDGAARVSQRAPSQVQMATWSTSSTPRSNDAELKAAACIGITLIMQAA